MVMQTRRREEGDDDFMKMGKWRVTMAVGGKTRGLYRSSYRIELEHTWYRKKGDTQYKPPC